MSSRTGIRRRLVRRELRRLALAVGMAGAVVGCSAKDSVEPSAVALVYISPASVSLDVGETLRLRATVENASGSVISENDVLWSTDRPDIAIVTQRGEVTALSAGDATISATVEGKRGIARVSVVQRKLSVSITAIAPNPLVEGQAAVITGQGFDSVAANNKVTIDGVVASVTAATPSRLTITVPAADCKPARNVDVRVTTADDQQGRTVSQPLRPPSVVNVPVGSQAIVHDPASFCLQFAPSANTEAYLIGVQSLSESVKSLTSAKIDAVSADASGASSMVAPATQSFFPRPTIVSNEDEIMRRHLASEARLRTYDREVFEQVRARPDAFRMTAGAMPASFPSTLKAGDTIAVRVPKRGNSCKDFIPIRAVVRVVGARAFWLEDVANPSGGYALSDLQLYSQLFDSQLYPGDVDYFGAPTDVDGNGRIAVVITQEVNKAGTGDTYLLGYVAPADLVSRNTCPSSNEGEVFYGRTPDATGAVGYPSGRADLLLTVPRNIAHEFVHIIQFGQRMYGGGPVVTPTLWEMEGQATLAEEVMGHRVLGYTTGRNYERDVVAPPSGLRWYWATMDEVGLYYGWKPKSPRIGNAPEQCSWLDLAVAGNIGPCHATDLLPYGVGWLFFRWLSDHFGPAFPGGEKGLQKALIALRQSGFAAVAGLVGVATETLLAQFSAMQYVDDRVPNADPRLTLPSWNLTKVWSTTESQELIPRERAFSTFSDAVAVRGGSTAYYRVSGTGRAGTALRVTAPDGTPLPSHMQVWVVRLR